LLMEAEMEKEAMFVLQRLVTDDDQSVEAWYLGGWCQNLIAEKLTAAGLSTDTPANGVDEENELLIALKGSRNWLKMALRLYDLLEYEDDRLCEHAKELVAALDRDLGPEAKDAGAGEEDEWEEWDGIDEDQDQDLEDEDEEMKDS
ncbi:hypothetical protein KC352_g46728, partial [Hortaea werneckii]